MLTVDGKEVDRKTIAHTIPLLMSIDETFGVGVDIRTSVDDFDYRMPFRFNDKINKLISNLGPEQLSAEDNRPKTKRSLRKYSRPLKTRWDGPVKGQKSRPEDVPTTANATEEEGDTAANMSSSAAGRVA